MMRCFGLILLSTLLVGCDVQFPIARNSPYLHYRDNPVQPIPPQSPGEDGLRYDFKIVHANHGGIELPNPTEQTEGVWINTPSDGSLEIAFHSYGWLEDGDIRYDDTTERTLTASGQLIPYYDKVFQVDYDERSVRMTEVTHLIPEPFRPHESSRVVALGEHDFSLFRRPQFHTHLPPGTEDHFARISVLKIEPEIGEAYVELLPTHRWVTDTNRAEEETGLVTTKQLRIGDTFEVDGHIVRLERIVPPVEILGVGMPIGWIELSDVQRFSTEQQHAAL
ncbi:hypothetical protein ACYFX5_16140 [Bremerella sp. T1]|uniref:hypothetical protein n=1 Tax=Bremerella sp. TYQ1 TaxID=3119568 RepID=UPI001CCFE972|nr:hypothetical protein [Bremerella volcania]UBM34587.1 hypothetical protein LA756_18090 [Bremerella volcania]